VLGLIAALTLPSIFNSVNASREKAVWKETLNTISVLFNQGAMEGFEGLELNNYLLDRINAQKVCKVSANSQGCFAFEEVNERGVNLQNGASISGLHGGHWPADNFHVDVNGANGPNVMGKDRMTLTVCLNLACGYPTRKIVGYVEPLSNSSVSVELYRSIYQ